MGCIFDWIPAVPVFIPNGPGTPVCYCPPYAFLAVEERSEDDCRPYVFLAVEERSEDRCRCYVQGDLSPMQRKTAKEEAWRPKCAAPIYDSALFSETFMHVYCSFGSCQQ